MAEQEDGRFGSIRSPAARSGAFKGFGPPRDILPSHDYSVSSRSYKRLLSDGCLHPLTVFTCLHALSRPMTDFL